MHSGKNGSAVHNERSFDLGKAEHINQELTGQNAYWCWTDDYRFSNGESFADAEREWYQIRYKEHLDAVNARYLAQRHPERCKTTDDLYKGDKTKPTETIWQIGNKDEAVPADVLLASYKKMSAERERLTKGHLQVLDWALHVDERGGAHIHERSVWEYKDKDGHIALGQNKALEQLGIELPNPEQAEGRFNNRKISFDGQMRELWQSIVQDMGLRIETEPVPGRRHLDVEEYIYQQQQERIADLQAQVMSHQQVLDTLSNGVKQAIEDIDKYHDSTIRAKAHLEALERDIETAREKLGILNRSELGEDIGKASFWNPGLIKLSKEDYEALRGAAAVGDSIDKKSKEFARMREQLDKREESISSQEYDGYNVGYTQGKEAAKKDIDHKEQELEARERAVRKQERYAFIGRACESHISPETLRQIDEAFERQHKKIVQQIR